jgi:isoaspartyl peptidase/L-asparaginase-like protein (Ntn-hydrolase superfamily)
MSEFVVASDWAWGVQAVVKGKEKLAGGSTAIDAVEAGICVVEDDPTCNSVGTGGLPNVDGVLELDASIMDGDTMQAGGVTCLTNTRNPISIARKVMELTPHVLLAGAGATEFARNCGFAEYEPLTAKSVNQWKELRRQVFGAENDEDARQNYLNLTSEHYGPSTILKLTKALRSNLIKSHGTVGVLAVDQHQRTCAGTSTSGWPLRFPGRVSDSSVIGAGTYANKKAAASATGVGETAMRYCLAREVCDLVSEGRTPNEACETALLKITRNETFDHLIAVICVSAGREVGGACTKDGFQYEYMTDSTSEPIIMIPKPLKC